MNGEARLLNKKEEPTFVFNQLEIGEGLVTDTGSKSRDGVRVKISHSHYLHFNGYGKVYYNLKFFWPDITQGHIREFKLIAEEI